MLAGTFQEQLQDDVGPVNANARGGGSVEQCEAEGSSNAQPEDATAFDPAEFENFSFDFGAVEAEPAALDSDPAALEIQPAVEAGRPSTGSGQALHDSRRDAGTTPEPLLGATPSDFPTPAVSTADILKFLIDRTGYIKLLEDEDTPEALSRIENLHELVNAAMDSRDRAETLDQFLDHAALVADADDYDERAQITLMSLHAAKGLEFPLVFLSGLEEGLFPHSRTMLVPEDIEEERRLCYVGMTRAMDQLILTRAVYRRRYGTDLPEASVPSRFLEEVPAPLLEELGTRRPSAARMGTGTFGRPGGRSPAYEAEGTHYSYEDEDQSASGTTHIATDAFVRRQGKSPRPPPAPTTQSRTSPSFLPAAARSSRRPKPQSKSPRASADSVRDRRYGIRNTAKERSTSAKEKAKKPRLRYNFLASD